MTTSDEGENLAVYVDFVNRGRRAQAAVDEVIGSSSEPEPEPEQDSGIREVFENEHYWGTRALLDAVLDATDDVTYRAAVIELVTAISRYPR